MRSYEPAQNTVEYALLVACVVLLVLITGYYWGAQLQAWLLELVQRITSSLSA